MAGIQKISTLVNRTMDFPQSHDLLEKQLTRPDKPPIPA
jgi:hypothetical protein